MTHSARRINHLLSALDHTTYLEIGVNEGQTFRLVEAGRKTGVDPHFLFPTADLASDSVRFHEVPSDTYFAGLTLDQKFDVIFIDGLHVFEQVVRDFTNALLHTHDRSVILLDDTLPSDIFSSLPDVRESVSLRMRFNNLSQDWHGDVFKIVPMINDFFPGLEFRTITTDGNPQTVVWRKPGRSRAPIFNSLRRSPASASSTSAATSNRCAPARSRRLWHSASATWPLIPDRPEAAIRSATVPGDDQ